MNIDLTFWTFLETRTFKIFFKRRFSRHLPPGKYISWWKRKLKWLPLGESHTCDYDSWVFSHFSRELAAGQMRKNSKKRPAPCLGASLNRSWRRRWGLNSRQSASQTAEEEKCSQPPPWQTSLHSALRWTQPGPLAIQGPQKTALCPRSQWGEQTVCKWNNKGTHTHTHSQGSECQKGSHSFSGLCK